MIHQKLGTMHRPIRRRNRQPGMWPVFFSWINVVINDKKIIKTNDYNVKCDKSEFTLHAIYKALIRVDESSSYSFISITHTYVIHLLINYCVSNLTPYPVHDLFITITPKNTSVSPM